MKNRILALALALGFLLPGGAWANRAEPFEGIYQIISQTDRSAAPPVFLLDADTLGNLWGRYAEGPLPADLEPYRQEPSIIAGFNNRDLIFFGLERGALIMDGFLAMDGGPGERLELRRRPDGQYDMGVSENGRVSVYLLAAPVPIDSR